MVRTRQPPGVWPSLPHLQMGYAPADWAGKPIIAIINAWSDINCHAHFKTRVEDVKRGVLQAGGFPLELPALSLSENFGTSYGASILHVSPEAFVGGTLAFIQTGDQISVDVPERKLDLLVSPEELERRRQQWTPPERKFERGYGWMFAQHILQADKGCDFDYLETSFGRSPGEPVIY